jgi:hypothetical protein
MRILRPSPPLYLWGALSKSVILPDLKLEQHLGGASHFRAIFSKNADCCGCFRTDVLSSQVRAASPDCTKEKSMSFAQYLLRKLTPKFLREFEEAMTQPEPQPVAIVRVYITPAEAEALTGNAKRITEDLFENIQ